MLIRLNLSSMILIERFWEHGVQGLKDCRRCKRRCIYIICSGVVAG